MTQNGVPRLRLSAHKEASTTTSPTTSPATTKQQRSAFIEGLKKTLRTPRLGRSKSERDVAATADIISGSLKQKKKAKEPSSAKTKTALKQEKTKMKMEKTKKMKGVTGAVAKTVSDPVKPRGLAKWNELLLEEKQRNKSMGDVLVLMKKDGAIERDEVSEGADEDADAGTTTTSDSDGTGGGHLSPLSPRHNPQALNCAQLKAMDQLRSAHPRAFER